MNPSNLAFTGLSGNFMSQWNWWNFQSGGYVAPTANDDLYFVGEQSSGDHTYLPDPITATPGTMQYMMMVGAGMPVNQLLHPNYDVTIPINDLPTLHGVHLVSNYTGHVSVSNGQGLGRLDLQTGNLDQLGDNSNVYIGIALEVLGGTLNSTSNVGDVVHITGNIGAAGVALAKLQPADGGSITIGSTISVEGLGSANTGSGLYQLGGNYLFDNDAGVVVDAFCTIQMGGDTCAPQVPQAQPFLEAAVQSKNGKAVQYTIKKDAYGEVKNIDIANGQIQVDGVLSVESGGGRLKVNTTSALPSITVSALAPGTVYTGVLTLGSDSVVTVNNGIRCSGTIYSSSSKAGTPDAIINGELDVLQAGSIRITLNTNSLNVNGDVRMDGQLSVKADAAGTAPSILKVSGKLDFGGFATLDVGAVPRNSVLQVWTVATAEGGISDQLPSAGSDKYTVIRSADKKKLQIQLVSE